MSPDELRRWIAARRAAAARERAEIRNNPPTASQAVQAALTLINFTANLHGWPPPEDPVTVREDREVRAAWAKLRQCWNES